MSKGRIPDHDSIFRHVLHPLSFRGKRFAQEKWIKLFDEADDRLASSVAWEKYTPTAELVHGYGCRLAYKINAKKKSEGKFTPKNRHVYCGAYRMTGKDVRSLVGAEGLGEITSADVVHRIEDGEIAHTDLIISLAPERVSNREGTKTAILDRLWNTCSGPMRHKCYSDLDLADHPSADLTEPPKGRYSDDRSPLRRKWEIVRFHALQWLWRKFPRYWNYA